MLAAELKLEVIPLPPLSIDGQPARAHSQGLVVTGSAYFVTKGLKEQGTRGLKNPENQEKVEFQESRQKRGQGGLALEKFRDGFGPGMNLELLVDVAEMSLDGLA